MMPRFKIRRHDVRAAARLPWILKDGQRPAWLGQYESHERALVAMDNAARYGLGLAPRLALDVGEIRAAMSDRLAS